MTALIILAGLNLVAIVALTVALLYVHRRKERSSDVLLVAIERLTDSIGKIGQEARPGPSLVGKTVVINTRKPDDQTIRGVVHGQYPDRWTLRDAVYVTGVGDQPIDGLEHVPVANVAFAQEIEA